MSTSMVFCTKLSIPTLEWTLLAGSILYSRAAPAITIVGLLLGSTPLL